MTVLYNPQPASIEEICRLLKSIPVKAWKFESKKIPIHTHIDANFRSFGILHRKNIALSNVY